MLISCSLMSAPCSVQKYELLISWASRAAEHRGSLGHLLQGHVLPCHHPAETVSPQQCHPTALRPHHHQQRPSTPASTETQPGTNVLSPTCAPWPGGAPHTTVLSRTPQHPWEPWPRPSWTPSPVPLPGNRVVPSTHPQQSLKLAPTDLHKIDRPCFSSSCTLKRRQNCGIVQVGKGLRDHRVQLPAWICHVHH